MPIYDYTYQTWEGERRGALFRWMAIPKFAFMEFTGNRTFIVLFTVAWFQFLVRLVYLYLFVNVEFLKFLNIQPQSFPPIDANFFKTMIDGQIFFCFVFAFMLGANLISRDLKHSAAVLYMSKPISRWEYFIGKFFAIFSLLMLVTWFQATLLFVVQASIAPEVSQWSQHFWKEYAWILAAIASYSTLVSATLSLMILAASSLTKNSRYAGATFAIFLIGAHMTAGIMTEVMRDGGYWVLSPFYTGLELGRYIFRDVGGGYQLSQPLAWAGILGVWALSAIILKRRLESAARYGR